MIAFLFLENKVDTIPADPLGLTAAALADGTPLLTMEEGPMIVFARVLRQMNGERFVVYGQDEERDMEVLMLVSWESIGEHEEVRRERWFTKKWKECENGAEGDSFETTHVGFRAMHDTSS